MCITILSHVRSEVRVCKYCVFAAQAVEFRNRLHIHAPGVPIPSTLVFDYPTPAAIGHLEKLAISMARCLYFSGPLACSMHHDHARSMGEIKTTLIQHDGQSRPYQIDEAGFKLLHAGVVRSLNLSNPTSRFDAPSVMSAAKLNHSYL